MLFAIIIIALLILLGVFIFPIINRRSFNRLPDDQKIRVLMKEAKGLAYFKNVSMGDKGVLYFVKNKRKILALPWTLQNGNMLCTLETPFDNWDYPEERQAINPDELQIINEQITKYNNKNTVKILFK